MSTVTLQGLSKRFGALWAVDDLHLEVANGEFFVLLGPTGAGKTTTLRLIAGLERADAGHVLIDGADMTDEPPAVRDVAFVFQHYSLYPHLNVYDNLAFPLRAPARRLPEDQVRARVREVADMLHIAHKLDNRATELSGGEMQRVSIGRALVRRPNAFLMDEPLSSLDAKLREELRIELKRIQQNLGATIIYVTHDQMEAMTLADRIGILHEGRLLQVGPPREIYERPDNLLVARRVGSPVINVCDPARLGLTGLPPATRLVGIRPEDIHVDPAGAITARVRHVEHLGAERVARVRVDDLELNVLLPPGRDMNSGETVRLGIAPGRVICFDRDERRLADDTAKAAE